MVGSGRVGSGRNDAQLGMAAGGRRPLCQDQARGRPQKERGPRPPQVTPILVRLARAPRENQNVPLIPLEYVKRHTCHISTAVLYRLGILAVANVKGNGGKCAGRIVTRTLHKVGWCPWSSELPLRHVFKKGEQ